VTLEVIIMWLQPPPPVTNRWVLHIAATPHEVDDVLADLCIHKRARPVGDPDYPAYLAGRETPYEPPAWMAFANAELQRRGYYTLWCDPDCPHHPWPPRTEPPAAPAGEWPAARRHRSGASLRRLTSGAPHHRGTSATPEQSGAPQPVR
jgi:hypothetical protein